MGKSARVPRYVLAREHRRFTLARARMPTPPDVPAAAAAQEPEVPPEKAGQPERKVRGQSLCSRVSLSSAAIVSFPPIPTRFPTRPSPLLEPPLYRTRKPRAHGPSWCSWTPSLGGLPTGHRHVCRRRARRRTPWRRRRSTHSRRAGATSSVVGFARAVNHSQITEINPVLLHSYGLLLIVAQCSTIAVTVGGRARRWCDANDCFYSCARARAVVARG